MNAELGGAIEVSEGVIATLASCVIRVLIGSHRQYGVHFITAEFIPPLLIE
jgi:hypothetical protein